MIRQLLKSTRLIFDIVLVAAAILLFYWWNPLNIFGGKPTLQPTANMVAEVIAMGELITAEYYGEVITSIQEAATSSMANPEVAQQANEAYLELKEMLIRLHDFDSLSSADKLKSISPDDPPLRRRDRNRLILDPVSGNNILDKLIYREDWEAFELLPLHAEVLTYLYEKSINQTPKIGNNLRTNQTKELLFRLYPDKIDPIWNSDEFFSILVQHMQADAPRQEAGKKLAMIGRGSVKAGFDLSELSPNMFYINEQSAELHFFGLAPKILNTDINPWFIPEKGIPGFDILTHSGKVNFKDAKKVKEFAVQKLEVSAVRADILNQAERFGGEVLKNLFSLITGKEIKSVFFHHDQIIQVTQQIVKDQFINYEEAVLFEEWVDEERRTIDSLYHSKENRYNNQQLAQQKWQTLIQMSQQVRQYPFESDDLPFNYFSTRIFEMGVDSLVQTVEIDTLKSVRNWLKTDASPEDSLLVLWAASDSLSLMHQFNQSVRLLLHPSIQVGEWRKIAYSNDSIDMATVDSLNARLLQKTEKESIFGYRSLDKAGDNILLGCLFPFTYTPEKWKEIAAKGYEQLNIVQMDTARVLRRDMGSMYIMYKKANKQSPWSKVPYTLADIFSEELLAKNTTENILLLEKDSVLLAVESNNLQQEIDSLQPVQWLTDEQRQEMAGFIGLLLRNQNQNASNGPIKKANEWFSSKLQSRNFPRFNKNE
nr:hypothetical protein [Cytophagales bacterium]